MTTRGTKGLTLEGLWKVVKEGWPFVGCLAAGIWTVATASAQNASIMVEQTRLQNSNTQASLEMKALKERVEGRYQTLDSKIEEIRVTASETKTDVSWMKNWLQNQKR